MVCAAVVVVTIRGVVVDVDAGGTVPDGDVPGGTVPCGAVPGVGPQRGSAAQSEYRASRLISPSLHGSSDHARMWTRLASPTGTSNEPSNSKSFASVKLWDGCHGTVIHSLLVSPLSS